MHSSKRQKLTRAVASALLLAVAHAAIADDITWVGTTPGFTDDQFNWDPAMVPGQNDRVYFPGAGGSVSFNSTTFDVDTFQLDGDDWTFSDGTLKTSTIQNEGGDNNLFDSTVTITGVAFFPQAYLVATADNFRTQIDGTIIDPDNFNPMDVYLHATLRGASTYTGTTHAWNTLEITGANGSILSSEFIDITASTFRLDNIDNVNEDRISDSALIDLRYGTFEMTGSGLLVSTITENTGSILIHRGASTIRFELPQEEESQTVQMHLTDDSQAFAQALLQPGRGTAVIQTTSYPSLGVNAKLTMATLPDGLTPGSSQLEQLVPYVIAESPDTFSYTPVIYDSGEDEQVGTSDDVGLRPFHGFEVSLIEDITNNDSEHAVAEADHTVTGPVAMNSLTLDYGFPGVVLTVNNTFHLKSGVMVVNGDGRIIGGGTITTGNGGEMYIHAPSGSVELSAHLDASTLILGGGNDVLLGGDNDLDEVHVNGARLILGHENAAGNGTIFLTEADLQVNFSQPLHNSIVTRGGHNGPSGGGAVIHSLDFGNNVTRTMSGRLEGDCPVGLLTQNTRLILTNTASNVFADSPFLYIAQNNVLQLDGTFGSRTTYTGMGFGDGGTIWLADSAKLMGSGFADCDVVVTNGTTMAPGNDTGQPIATFTAYQLNLQTGGTLEMDVSATGTRGVDYDALDVLDTTLFLNGTIKLLRGASNLPVGSTFDIIYHDGQRLGNPALAVDNALTGGKQYVKIFYPDKLVIGIAGDDGDANLDGAVNTLDFNMLAGNFGVNSGANWLMGDFNYSFGVDSMDFNIFAGNYGKKIPGPAPLGASVPEPASGIVALATVYALSLRRRRG